MSHVDEGALHAYLDGALDEFPRTEAERIRGHLDACSECTERLEIARSERADAHAMLNLAAPEVELPTLEELRTYVKQTRRTPSKMSVRMYRMGWAASVVLALGTGWVLRDGQVAQDAVLERQLGAPIVERAADRAEVEGAADVVRPRVVTETAATGSVETATAARIATPEMPEDESSVVVPRSAESDVMAARTDRNEVLGGSEEPAPTGSSLRDRELLDPVGGGAALDQAEKVADDLDAAMEALPDVAGAEVAEEVAALSMTIDSGAVPGTEAVEEAERSFPATTTFSSAMESRAGAVPPPAESRTDGEEEPPMSVPELEVLSVTNLGQGTTAYGVYFRQQTADGVLVDVYHLSEGIEPAALPSAREGQNQVEGLSESGWIVLRAPLESEVLDLYLSRLIPEGGLPNS